jgi:prepilin signal peptidase PulO-like enzyme (type II secretory pathway)
LSYLKLAGKCRHCDEHIPISTLLYEIVCGLFFLTLFTSFGLGMELVAALGFFCILFILGEVDRREGLVPELISIPGTIIMFLLSCWTIGWELSLLGILFGAIFFQVQHLVTQGRGIGLGDMRVGSLMGAYFGGHVIIPLILLGYIFASIRALFGLYISGGFTMKTELHLVPYLALSAFIFLYFGDILIIGLTAFLPYGY